MIYPRGAGWRSQPSHSDEAWERQPQRLDNWRAQSADQQRSSSPHSGLCLALPGCLARQPLQPGNEVSSGVERRPADWHPPGPLALRSPLLHRLRSHATDQRDLRLGQQGARPQRPGVGVLSDLHRPTPRYLRSPTHPHVSAPLARRYPPSTANAAGMEVSNNAVSPDERAPKGTPSDVRGAAVTNGDENLQESAL